MGGASLVRKRWPTSIAVYSILRGVGLLVLVWVVWSVLAALGRDHLWEVASAAPGSILLAACLYALGQLMRIVRLALLIGNARLSLRRLTSFHLFTVGVALGTPLRLGDLFRAIELGRMTGGVVAGLTYVWIERVLDAAIILPILLVEIGSGESGAIGRYLGIAVFTFLFIVASILMVALLPDNLRRMGTYLIRRHEGYWTIWVLRRIDEARATIRRIPAIVRGKVASLAALTVLVWCFEIGGFVVVMLAWRRDVDPLGGLLAFLSQTTAGGTLPDMLAPGVGLGSAVIAYLAASQVPLAIIAVIAMFYYLRLPVRRKTS